MRDATPTPRTPLADHLPGVASAVAQWSRLLYDGRLPALLRRSALTVELHPVQAEPAGRVFALGFQCDGAAVQVELADARDPSLAMATAPAVSEPVRRLAAQTLFGSAAAALNRLGLGEWVAGDLSAHAEPQRVATASPWVDVRRDGARLATLRVVQAPTAVRDGLGARLRAEPAAVRRRSGWAVAARVVLHRQAYGVDLLASLARGDVVLLTPPAAQAGRGPRPVAVHWGLPGGLCLRAPGLIDEDVLTIQGAPTMQDDTDEPAAPASDAPDVLGQLDLPVRFEIDTVAMSLGDIEAIAPGCVIELATPLQAAAIRLVACGQVIGHAELVAVGDHLGARITRMVAR